MPFLTKMRRNWRIWELIELEGDLLLIAQFQMFQAHIPGFDLFFIIILINQKITERNAAALKFKSLLRKQ